MFGFEVLFGDDWLMNIFSKEKKKEKKKKCTRLGMVMTDFKRFEDEVRNHLCLTKNSLVLLST